MSYLLTKELADEAVELVMPAILRMMDKKIAKRAALHIAIVDPHALPLSDERPFEPGQEPIIFEASLGREEGWENPYDLFACRKAELSWRHQQDTAVIVLHKPHLMIQGDCKYTGGVYFEGIPVGVSGIQSYFDEMIARMVAASCIALCKQAMEKIQADTGRHRL